jgi:protein-S-isoprenylcysteine O-methyltransferase Ste14
LLYLALGTILKDISWASIALFAVATISLVATSIADEHECIKHFGPPYREYMTTTKRFIPYLL